MKLIECVPNFSEGRRTEVVEAIRNAIASVQSVSILDVSSDASHNRSVITFVAPLESAVEAALAGIREAAARIDLTSHSGEHPRIGAADVVPFVPLEGATMDDCIALANELGIRVGDELGIPVYLYERAAARPTRRNLADVRRGQFEGLRNELGTNPERAPDYGPNRIHPTAGAVAIGARPFLVAYNVYIGSAEHLALAKNIAKAVRESSGGFPHVKGLGLEVDGQAQVSMNLVDTEQTPLHVPYDFIAERAREGGSDVTWSEIVGLVPERVLFDSARHYLKLTRFTHDQVLERRVLRAMHPDRPGDASMASATDMPRNAAAYGGASAFAAAVASGEPVPGGGSVAAHAASLAAALVQMVAGLTIGKKRYAASEDEMRGVLTRAENLRSQLTALVQRDADAYSRVSAAYRLPKDSAERSTAVSDALISAAEVPLEAARAAVEVAELAAAVAARGNTNAVTDAGVAALMAETACRGAAWNVRVNVMSLENGKRGAELDAEARNLAQRASRITAEVAAVVERALT